MPKRKRHRGVQKRPGLLSSQTAQPGEEEDSDGLGVEDMLEEDVELEPSHALFLTKIKP